MCREEKVKYRFDISYVDMDEVRRLQSLPKNPYTPEELKKREAEIMEQIKRSGVIQLC